MEMWINRCKTGA